MPMVLLLGAQAQGEQLGLQMQKGLAVWVEGEAGLAGPALALPLTKSCSISA